MKLQNAGVLWLSGTMFGWALPDVLTVMHIYNPSSWSTVAIEFTLAAVTAAMAFHPITSGSSAKSL